MAGWGDGLRWDAGPMEAEASANRQRVATLQAQHQGVLAMRPPVWFGKAADRSRQDFRLMLHRWAELADLLSQQADIVSDAAAELRRLQADQRDLQRNAVSKRFSIGDSGWVSSTASFPASLDPRRAWWWSELSGAVVSIVLRLNGFDGRTAFALGKLVVNDLLDGAQQTAIDWTNSGFAGAQDLLSGANQWMVDAAEVLWPDAVGPLQAWQRASNGFMDEAGRQPRWLQEMLYTGKLPAPSEVLGQGLYLGMHAVGDVTGTQFFDDGSPYVPTLRGTEQINGPASVTDLIANLERSYDTRGPDDSDRTDRPAVEVSVIEGHPPRFIVNVPGTTIGMGSINGWTGDIEGTDWPADAKAVGYGDSAVTQSTKAAIDLAIREYESTHGPIERPNILLTGHSQGGIIAANIAADPAFTARYQVDGVVSAGSPINTIPINPDVPALNFHHTTDVVPKLDLGGVHPQPNVTEVHLPRWTDPGTAHGVPTYATDVATHSQGNADIQRFNDLLAPYLTGQGNVVTYQYDVGRQ